MSKRPSSIEHRLFAFLINQHGISSGTKQRITPAVIIAMLCHQPTGCHEKGHCPAPFNVVIIDKAFVFSITNTAENKIAGCLSDSQEMLAIRHIYINIYIYKFK